MNTRLPVRFILVTLFWSIVSSTLTGQVPSYIRYTIADGLPTNYVYGVIEDVDGFIWAYTENGLAKFDGYTFQHYGTSEGLPGNDVFWALRASDGKIWLSIYQNRPAYLWKDSIYITHEEQARLKGLDYKGRPIYSIAKRSFVYEENWIQTPKDHILDATELNYFGQEWRKLGMTVESTERRIVDGEVFVAEGDSLAIWSTVGGKPFGKVPKSDTSFLYQHNDSLYWKVENVWKSIALGSYFAGFHKVPGDPSSWVLEKSWESDGYAILNLEEENIQLLNMADYGIYPDIYTQVRLQDSSCWMISDAGSIELSYSGQVLRKLTWTAKERNWSVLSVYKDREGNIWQGTRNGGLLMIPFAYQGAYQRGLPPDSNPSLKRLLKTSDDQIFAIASKGEVYEIRPDTILQVFQPAKKTRFRTAEMWGNNLLLALDAGLFHLDMDTPNLNAQLLGDKFDCKLEPSVNFSRSDLSKNVNSITWDDNTRDLYIINPHIGQGYQWELGEVNNGNCLIRQMQSKSRLLYFHPIAAQLYGGGLEGLSIANGDQFRPLLRQEEKVKDISTLYGTAGKLWIGTESNGLFCYHIAQDTLEKIASVNYVHAIRSDGNRGVLVATNEGLLLVPEKTPNSYKVLGVKDGLPTNKIEDVIALGDTALLVASNFGLHQINRRSAKLPPVSDNALQLRTIRANEKTISAENLTQLPYTTRQLEFTFRLRSYASRGNIQYRTRLEPLESKWSESSERSRSYFGLSPGKYVFHLHAIDAYGREQIHSPTTVVIRAALWQRLWFQVFLGLCLLGAIIVYSRSRIRKTQGELAKEQALNKRLAEMEMQALKAQMNPHFIFNALGSIQYFIQTQEVELADDYLTRFAKLMRLYLESSRETLLPLAQEIDLLKNYIVLEQMRFEDQFQVALKVDEDILVSSYTIPSMIIQPFVENAIIHGLGERRDGQGQLTISFACYASDTICCIIRDNGVGRKQSANRGKEGHRSRGMQIVQDKIDTLGAADLVEVSYTIQDAEPENTAFPGTIVTIYFKSLQEE